MMAFFRVVRRVRYVRLLAIGLFRPLIWYASSLRLKCTCLFVPYAKIRTEYVRHSKASYQSLCTSADFPAYPHDLFSWLAGFSRQIIWDHVPLEAHFILPTQLGSPLRPKRADSV
jgi:hypothetical protein